MLEMLDRMANPHRPADTGNGATHLFLPGTIRLLDRIRGAVSPEDVRSFDVQDPRRTASYRARPDPNLPHLAFHLTDADQNLLALAGREAPGFEVLQVICSGLQYHWRSDLVRAFEEGTPLVSRFYGLSDARELVVEHLALPLIRKHRVREILGWFLFSQELNSCSEWASLNSASLFRRAERSRSVQLPTKLYNPDGRAAPQDLLRALKTRWRAT